MTNRPLIGFVHKPELPSAIKMCHRVAASLGVGAVSWIASAADLAVDEGTLRETRLIITAGGDGTILRVARAAAPYEIPILGINMGRVGFMAEVSVKDAEKRIPFYLNGEPRIEERLMLQATVRRPGENDPWLTVHALNDAVVSRGAVARLIDVDVTIDGAHLATYRADGVIAATATGSTGYALSAGGPVLHPESKVLLIQPLAAHISLQTGVVIPDTSVLELRVPHDDGDAVLSVDGMTDSALTPTDTILVQRSPYVARFLRADPPSAFYAALTGRLGVKQRTTYQPEEWVNE